MDMNIPNSLTVTRIAMIPVLVLVFYWEFENHQLVAAGVFGLAAITDWVDGYLARKLAQMTQFGAFLDPVADKLMVAVALVLLVDQERSIGFTIAACVIIGREIVVSALREWMAELGQRTSVAVSYVGKVKTFVQMLAIFLLLGLSPDTGPAWARVGVYAMIYVAAGLTLYSMLVYLKAAWKVLEEQSANNSSS